MGYFLTGLICLLVGIAIGAGGYWYLFVHRKLVPIPDDFTPKGK